MRKALGSYCNLVPEFAVEDLSLGMTAALVPESSESPALGQNTGDIYRNHRISR